MPENGKPRAGNAGLISVRNITATENSRQSCPTQPRSACERAVERHKRSLIIYTRDAVVPLTADDPDMDRGWRSIPIPPSEGDWILVDKSKDRRSGWCRADLFGLGDRA
jgi:hypothetical protein